MHKEVKELLRGIEHIEGVELRDSGKGHIVVSQNGKFVASISRTPSDTRWRAFSPTSASPAGESGSMRGTSSPRRGRGSRNAWPAPRSSPPTSSSAGRAW